MNIPVAQKILLTDVVDGNPILVVESPNLTVKVGWNEFICLYVVEQVIFCPIKPVEGQDIDKVWAFIKQVLLN